MKRIVIATSPRTGSNLLVDSLATHSQAVGIGEFFQDMLPEYAERNRASGEPWNLCKLFAMDKVQPPFGSILQDSFIVFLHRIDREAQVASWARACATGKYTEEDPGEPIAPPPEGFGYWIDEAQRLFAPVCDIAIRYEDMVDDWDNVVRCIFYGARWPQQRVAKARKRDGGWQALQIAFRRHQPH